MLLIVILLGILASFYIKTNPRIVFVRPSMPIWWGPAGKIPPSEIVPLCVVQILAALVALEIYKRVNF